MKNLLFSIFNDEFESVWWNYLTVGLLFFLAGVVIILVPEILIALIASVFLLIGLFFVFIALQVRKMQKRLRRIKIHYIN